MTLAISVDHSMEMFPVLQHCGVGNTKKIEKLHCVMFTVTSLQRMVSPFKSQMPSVQIGEGKKQSDSDIQNKTIWLLFERTNNTNTKLKFYLPLFE